MDLTAIIAAILSALGMGTVGVFAKITGLGAEVITFFRLALGACFMLLFLLLTGQLRLVRRWPGWPVLVNGAMLAGLSMDSWGIRHAFHLTAAAVLVLPLVAALLVRAGERAGEHRAAGGSAPTSS